MKKTGMAIVMYIICKEEDRGFMSNFRCEICGTLILHSLYGRYIGCDHYPIDVITETSVICKEEKK